MSLYTFDANGELLVHGDKLYYRPLGYELPGHKYQLRIRLPNGKYRYFYTQKQIDAYYNNEKQRRKDSEQGRYRPDVNITEAHKTSHIPSPKSTSSRNTMMQAPKPVDAKEYTSDKEAAKANLKNAKEYLKEVKKTNPDKRIQNMGPPVDIPNASTLAARDNYGRRLQEAEELVKAAEEEYNAAKKQKKSVINDLKTIVTDPKFVDGAKRFLKQRFLNY